MLWELTALGIGAGCIVYILKKTATVKPFIGQPIGYTAATITGILTALGMLTPGAMKVLVAGAGSVLGLFIFKQKYKIELRKLEEYVRGLRA